MRTALTLALIVAPLAAQTVPAVITPAAATSALGGTNNNIPFSWTPCSYQQVHSLSSFSNQSATVFTQMRLRMASGFVNYAGNTVDMEMFFAQSPNDHAAASSIFANNVVPASEVAVFTRKIVTMPTVPNNNWAVAPFMLDVPFPWPSTHFSWRVNQYGNGNGNQIFTYPLDAWSGTSGSSTVVGVGCKAANGSAASTHTTTIGPLGGTLTLTGNSFINSADPAIATIGTSTTTWGPFTLPLDLGIIGAGGCNVYNDIAVTIAGVTSATGTVSLFVPIPNNPLLGGAILQSQYVIINGGANAGGLITTNTRTNKLAPYVGATRIYGLATPPVTSGTLGVNFAMAVGFN